MARSRVKRIPELDAVRGLAALSVVIFHYVLALRGADAPHIAAFSDWMGRIGDTPVGLLWAGHQAVVMFFVLSGFVLYVMLRQSDIGYPAYLLKRTCRLYLPYLAAVFLGVALEHLLSIQYMSALGQWINKFWSWPITSHSVMRHVFFLDEFNSDRYDFTIWSLVHEMRISLLFPAIMFVVVKTRWWVSLGAAAGLSASMMAVRFAAYHHWTVLARWLNVAPLTSYTLTLHYVFAFAVGALLARHRLDLKRWYRALDDFSRLVMVLLALASYFYGARLVRDAGVPLMSAQDWPVLLGAAGLLAIALSAPRARRWLRRPSLAWLGRISYSLYLFHPLVLLTFLHLSYGRIPMEVLLPAAFITTFPLTCLAYRLFERPAVMLSRRVPNGVRPGTAVAGDRR